VANLDLDLDTFVIPADRKVKLKDYSTSRTDPYRSREAADEKLRADVLELTDWQAKLYAQNTYALLVILQGLDGSGKDSAIKHVMSGVNPMGCDVTNFKVPSQEELDHDYLWRATRALPERGKIMIFNRSYYEEVLVVRVHPEVLERQRIPPLKKNEKLWPTRFREINDFERYLTENGVVILKFYLHLSKEKQKLRFLERLELREKNWKFSDADVRERSWWDDYTRAYEDMLTHTSTAHVPWHLIPADHKWYTHVVVASLINRQLAALKLHFPELDEERQHALRNAKKLLENSE
jgi:PPK2 family polyphosphate:nucleotide phosphotransferase